MCVSLQTCAAVDVEEHVWDLEEKRGLIGSSDGSDSGDRSRRAGGADGLEMSERGAAAAPRLARRESNDDDDNASWRGSGGSDTASWRGSGSALLLHVALSSSPSAAMVEGPYS